MATEVPARLYEGLNLSMAEDRVIFRMRVSEYFKITSMEALREWSGLPKTARRFELTRAIADQLIAEKVEA